MAVDMFLKIDGVDGESIDRTHKDHIEILSFSWGATQLGSSGGADGGGAGKVSISDFHFTTKVSKASPKLFLACATGEHFKKATLYVRNRSSSPDPYLKVTLEDCLVSSYQAAPGGGSDSGDPVPTEQVSLNFTKIQYSVAPLANAGALASPVSAGYDLKLNKKV